VDVLHANLGLHDHGDHPGLPGIGGGFSLPDAPAPLVMICAASVYIHIPDGLRRPKPLHPHHSPRTLRAFSVGLGGLGSSPSFSMATLPPL
jgi:hypothetical protein